MSLNSDGFLTPGTYYYDAKHPYSGDSFQLENLGSLQDLKVLDFIYMLHSVPHNMVELVYRKVDDRIEIVYDASKI